MNAIGPVSPLAAGQPHGSHPLLRGPVVAAVERAVSADLGRRWSVGGFTDLTDRASHPAGIYRSAALSVFAKLDPAGGSQFAAEVRGLDLLSRLSGVATPAPVAGGVVPVPGGTVLLTQAIPEIPAAARTPDQWRSIGHALAQVHLCHGPGFGLDFDGYFGPLRQDNRPLPSWSSFYTQRRLLPCLRSAVDSGLLPPSLADGVERVAGRLPLLAGPEPRPTLLHGDPQQNNFLTAGSGAVLLDACPYFGHPEVDLALLDYFEPVPGEVFDAYREVAPIDPGYWERRDLLRLFAYLAVVAVAGVTDFGRPFQGRIADAVARYR
jgi:fructosamine-3-kinase